MTTRTIDPSLANRVVLITGGGFGMGAELIRQFCTQGREVACVDVDVEASLLAAGDSTACASQSYMVDGGWA